jgi:hypothetical protein
VLRVIRLVGAVDRTALPSGKTDEELPVVPIGAGPVARNEDTSADADAVVTFVGDSDGTGTGALPVAAGGSAEPEVNKDEALSIDGIELEAVDGVPDGTELLPPFDVDETNAASDDVGKSGEPVSNSADAVVDCTVVLVLVTDGLSDNETAVPSTGEVALHIKFWIATPLSPASLRVCTLTV